MEKANHEKGPPFIPSRTTHDDIKVREKDTKFSSLVSQLGIAKPNQCTSELQCQASHPTNQVIEAGPGVECVTHSRALGLLLNNQHLKGFGRGMTTRPEGSMEFVPTEISFSVRIPSQTIEFLGCIHKKPIYVLLDIGSTGNYISDKIVQSFNLISQQEEGYEYLTFVVGSKVQA